MACNESESLITWVKRYYRESHKSKHKVKNSKTHEKCKYKLECGKDLVGCFPISRLKPNLFDTNYTLTFLDSLIIYPSKKRLKEMDEKLKILKEL